MSESKSKYEVEVLRKTSSLIESLKEDGNIEYYLGESFDSFDQGEKGYETASILALIKDLENNLRIVDIYSIEFSSSANTKLKSYLPEAYKYNLKIRTYWLKN